MPGSTFQTNPFDLNKLLDDCHQGFLQLPDFQRSWVWDEDRIKSLIASISRAFPIGALMTLDTGGPVNFKPRPVEGAPASAKQTAPQSLLLDGQQRMTSLYQVTLRGQVVETVTPKMKKVKRWFYIDIRKALDLSADREDAIVGVPEDRIVKTDFGRKVFLDLSSAEKEYASLMYPVSQVFDCNAWQYGFYEYWRGDRSVFTEFLEFQKTILDNFKYYRVPVIALDRSTSKEAVCVVFEKVNTGGKPLDAFELVTAMYAASGHELRKDWYGKEATRDEKATIGLHRRFVETYRLAGDDSGILANVANTDFLQAISLFHTRDRRREAEAAGKQGKELPAVTGNRQALLNLPLDAYKRYQTFPQDWCKRQNIKADVYDSIINKTPLSYRTNRIVGGVPPSEYLAKLQKGDATTPPITREKLDSYLTSHLITPSLLYGDQFNAFMADRQKQLLALIEQATGNPPFPGDIQEEGEDVDADEDTIEAEHTIAVE